MQVLGSSIVLAGGVVIGTLSVVQDLPGRSGLVRVGALSIAYITSTFTAAMILGWEVIEDWIDDDFMARAMAVSWILTAFSATSTPIVSRLATAETRRRERMGEQSKNFGLSGVRLVCPNCSTEVIAPPGESACPKCNLGFNIVVSEIECACGYNLMGIADAACPECGSTSNAGRTRAKRYIEPRAADEGAAPTSQ
jgi:hypothetical protein